MRGHDNARLATGRRSKCFTSRSKLHAARQQRDWNRWLELLHHPANGFGMLLGQHLSRGNKHGLIAGVYGLEHGSERHYGFAGAHLALQQTLHWPVMSQIGGNIMNNLLLPCSEGERQGCDELIAQTVGYQRARVSRGFMGVRPGFKQRGLRNESLLIAQGFDGFLEPGRGGRIMNGQERLSPMHEVLGLAHRFGQHIWDGLGERLSTGFGGRAGLLFPVLDGDGVGRGSHDVG